MKEETKAHLKGCSADNIMILYNNNNNNGDNDDDDQFRYRELVASGA